MAKELRTRVVVIDENDAELRDAGRKHHGASHSEGSKMSMRKAIKQIALDSNKDELPVSSDDATEDAARGVGPQVTPQLPHQAEAGSHTHTAEIDDDNNDNIDSDGDIPMRDHKPSGHEIQLDVDTVTDGQSPSRMFGTAGAQLSSISRSSNSSTNINPLRLSNGSLYLQTEDPPSEGQHLMSNNATGIKHTSLTSLSKPRSFVLDSLHDQQSLEDEGTLSISTADLVGELKQKVNQKDEHLD